MTIGSQQASEDMSLLCYTQQENSRHKSVALQFHCTQYDNNQHDYNCIVVPLDTQSCVVVLLDSMKTVAQMQLLQNSSITNQYQNTSEQFVLKNRQIHQQDANRLATVEWNSNSVIVHCPFWHERCTLLKSNFPVKYTFVPLEAWYVYNCILFQSEIRYVSLQRNQDYV